MKNHPNLWLVALLLMFALTACTAAPAPSPAMAPTAAALQPAKEVILYTWTEYIDPEIYTQFEQETGIRVIEDNFSSNEELLAKLQGGASGYAMILPSDYTISILRQQNLLQKLDKTNIPNLANVADRFRSTPYDPGNEFCGPYQWGATGIGYDASVIDAPTSWASILAPDPSQPTFGRTTMLDDAREAFAIALLYLGYDINTTDEKQLTQAKDLLIQAKKGLSGYDSDTFENLVASGENVMAQGWNGDFQVQHQQNENVMFAIPHEGSVIWGDAICIPTTATPGQKLAAEIFINFLLRPEIGAMLSQWTQYPSPNKAAEAILGEEFLNDPNIYPPQPLLDKLHFIEPVGAAEAIYQRLWDEVKSATG